MRTLNLSISDIEYNQFGLKAGKLTFSDFIDIMSKKINTSKPGLRYRAGR